MSEFSPELLQDCPLVNTKLRFVRSFDKKQLIFCPPPPRRSTGDNEASEPLDSERSALGNAYNMAVHFAVGHMRRWDGAYPALNDGAKAVDWFVKKGQRCVTLTCFHFSS